MRNRNLSRNRNSLSRTEAAFLRSEAREIEKYSLHEDERGFGLVAFLALMPLLIAILSLVTGVVFILKSDARLKHECRTELLKAQRGIAGNLNRLLSMNKAATALRAERLLAEAKVVATSAAPPAHAAALAELALVKARQRIFKFGQQAIIRAAETASTLRPRTTAFSMKRELDEELKIAGGRRAWPLTRTKQGSFDVVETPKGDDSPDYNPAENFTDTQEMSVVMEVNLEPLLPEWVKKFLPARNLKLKTQCHASIEKEANEWIEKLSADK